MPGVDDLAEAALSGDGLRLRSVAQDWLRETIHFSAIPAPLSTDPQVRTVAAALVEMFAERANQSAPQWAWDIPSSPRPLFLLREALVMKRLRDLCETQGPPALRKRKIYAPPDFLRFA